MVDPRTVEVFQLLAAEDGIKVGFTVYSVNYGVDDMLHIYGNWQLKRFPDISEVHQTQRHALHEDAQTAMQSDPNAVTLCGVDANSATMHIPLGDMSPTQRSQMKAMDPQLFAMHSVHSMSDESMSPRSGTSEVASEFELFMGALQWYAVAQRERYEAHAMAKESPLVFAVGADRGGQWRAYGEPNSLEFHVCRQCVVSESSSKRS